MHGKSHRETDLEDESKLRNLTASQRNKRLCNGRTLVIYAFSVMTNTRLPRISNCSSSASTSNSHNVLVQVLVEVIIFVLVVIVSSIGVWQVRNKRRRARQTTSLQHESADKKSIFPFWNVQISWQIRRSKEESATENLSTAWVSVLRTCCAETYRWLHARVRNWSVIKKTFVCCRHRRRRSERNVTSFRRAFFLVL